MLIDTHCHLDADEFAPDREAVIARARAAGVHRMVLPAVHAAGFAGVRRLAAAHPELSYALGIHPLFVHTAHEQDLLALRHAVEAALPDPQFVGIGEIGLDHFVPGLDRARMEAFFVAQVRLACEFELPVILHVRRAQDAVLKQLRRARPQGGIAHAFNGSLQQAQAFINLGCALGFGGAMTWSRALQIRQRARELPLEHLVLETDAPDIPPEWNPRGRNEPAELVRIAAMLADLRGVTPEVIAASSAAAARQALPRLQLH